MNLLLQQEYFINEVVPAALRVARGESMERISRDEMLMDIAWVVKLRSTCLRRQVGAVLAVDGRVLSSGYNGAPAGLPHCTPTTCSTDRPCIDTVHGEANAIAFAARYGIRVEGSTLYTTASPCRACAILTINAGIVRVVYDTEYRDTSPIAILQQAGIRVERWSLNHTPPDVSTLPTSSRIYPSRAGRNEGDVEGNG